MARLAQRGKGRKVRFQGGTVFPAAVLIVVVLGLLAIFYARQSRPDPGSSPPTIEDHWHAAYGMYVCDTWLPKLSGNMEETVTNQGGTSYVNDLFGSTGVHSHDDGVIHYHPYSTKSVGKRAKLGVFLDVYDIELTPEELRLPEADGGTSYKAADYKCGGKDVEIKVVVWNSYLDTGDGETYVTDFEDIPIDRDGKVFSIAVVERGKKVTMPPWASELPALGAIDGGSTGQTTPTSVGDPTTTVDSASTTTVDSASTTTASGATSTAPATTTATTTPR